MRRKVDRNRLEKFMRALAEHANRPAKVFFTGGTTAVQEGWRDATIDVDIQIVPETDEILRAIPALKERLQINIEFASPPHFIPEVPGWEERSTFIVQEGFLSFYHYDFHAQALSKIERSHERDIADVKEMLLRGLVQPNRLKELFALIEPNLYRFPAINPPSFRRKLESLLSEVGRG